MKRIIAALMMALFVFSTGTVAGATENEISPHVNACTCGGVYSAKRRYWDYNTHLQTRICIYQLGAVCRDYYLAKFEATVCNQCGDIYSQHTIDYMWYCPDKGQFYRS